MLNWAINQNFLECGSMIICISLQTLSAGKVHEICSNPNPRIPEDREACDYEALMRDNTIGPQESGFVTA